jgi:hypothetical protein
MDSWRDCKRIFDFFPRKKLTIEFAHRVSQPYITEIKGLCPDWKVKADQRQVYRELHDRYLLINRKMEIILSSGIYYLSMIPGKVHLFLGKKREVKRK